MFLTVDTSITIRAAADAVWDYACKPENWTASNRTEHFGLTFDSPDNLPLTQVSPSPGGKASRAYVRSFTAVFTTWIVLVLRSGQGLPPIAFSVACSLSGSLKAEC